MKVATQVLKIAGETAAMILRIDSSFVDRKKGPPAPHTSMRPGAPGNRATIPKRKFPRKPRHWSQYS